MNRLLQMKFSQLITVFNDNLGDGGIWEKSSANQEQGQIGSRMNDPIIEEFALTFDLGIFACPKRMNLRVYGYRFFQFGALAIRSGTSSNVSSFQNRLPSCRLRCLSWLNALGNKAVFTLEPLSELGKLTWR